MRGFACIPKNWSIFIILLLIFPSSIYSCTSQKKNLRQVPRSQRKGLAVLNFRDTSPKTAQSRYEPWQYGLPAMLMTDLESIGLFNLVSRERLKEILSEQVLQASGIVDKRTIVNMGKLVAANYILTGSYSVLNDRMRIEAQVFSVENGAQLGAAEVTGDTEAFFELEKQLLFKVSNYLHTMLTKEEEIKIAGNIETKSVQASLYNYAGEMVMEEIEKLKKLGKIKETKLAKKRAAGKFNKALEYDPAYERARINLRKVTMGVPLTL